MFPDSSAVELSTVNRAAVGSNPTQGAIFSQNKTIEPALFLIRDNLLRGGTNAK